MKISLEKKKILEKFTSQEIEDFFYSIFYGTEKINPVYQALIKNEGRKNYDR